MERILAASRVAWRFISSCSAQLAQASAGLRTLFYDLARQGVLRKIWFDFECMLLRLIEQLEQTQQDWEWDVVGTCSPRSHGLFLVETTAMQPMVARRWLSLYFDYVVYISYLFYSCSGSTSIAEELGDTKIRVGYFTDAVRMAGRISRLAASLFTEPLVYVCVSVS